MRQSPQRQLPILLAVILAILLSWTPALTARATAQAPTPPEVVRLSVEVAGGIDTAALETRYRADIDTALDEFQSLFATRLTVPLTISFTTPPDRAIQANWQQVGDLAWIAPARGQADVDLNRFLALSPVEAANVLRNLIARAVLAQAAGGALPAGLADGIAAYVERPVLAEQARRGSLVQQVDIAGGLPSLALLVNAGPVPLSPEARTALHYAFVAFITDHYGVASLQQVVLQAAGATNWQAPLVAATGQDIAQLDTAWQQFLPRWYSGGWQVNAISGFDMSRAQALFDRGAYTSAISLAEQSQQLFSDLNDQVRLAEVEAFIARCAIGVRTEQLMKDVQARLEQHDYADAGSKLDQAEAEYANLPASHRPATLIDTYRGLIDTGLAATANLGEANRLSGNWSKTREARNLARDAGNAFAGLGDTANVDAARELVNTLNNRLQRITLLAVALVVLVAAWLLIWLWARAPQRYLWTEPRRLAGTSGKVP